MLVLLHSLRFIAHSQPAHAFRGLDARRHAADSQESKADQDLCGTHRLPKTCRVRGSVQRRKRKEDVGKTHASSRSEDCRPRCAASVMMASRSWTQTYRSLSPAGKSSFSLSLFSTRHNGVPKQNSRVSRAHGCRVLARYNISLAIISGFDLLQLDFRKRLEKPGVPFRNLWAHTLIL